MSRFHAAGSAVYVDEFDISGVSNAVEIDLDNPTPDVTAFADTDETFVEGKPVANIRLNGFHSVSSPDYDGEMFTDLTAASRRLGVYADNVAGEFGYEFRTDITQDTVPAKVSNAILLNVAWQATHPQLESQNGLGDTIRDCAPPKDKKNTPTP